MLFHRLCFRLRFKSRFRSTLRRFWWSAQGAQFGKNTFLPQLFLTWPHQLKVGNNCILEGDINFKFDGQWQLGPSIVIGDQVFIGRGCEFNITRSIVIGDNCLIASGCKFIDHDHGTQRDIPMNVQPPNEGAIVVEENVWLGVNVIVLKGVVIGAGAIVAAGAVVTKSIGSNQIWAGIPARKIKDRE